MKSFITDIIKYEKNRNIEYMRTKYNIPIKDEDEIDFFVLNSYLIEWIKYDELGYLYASKGAPKNFNPLEINAGYPWCRVLIKLIEEKTIYSKYFCISNGLFDYRPEITLEEKKRLREFTINNHIPFLMIDQEQTKNDYKLEGK